LGSIPSHRASIGEILEVLWFDCHGAIIFGDRKEIACIPHAGCRLEILATPPSPHRKVDLLLPGQVIRSMHSFMLGDQGISPSLPFRVSLMSKRRHSRFPQCDVDPTSTWHDWRSLSPDAVVARYPARADWTT